MIVHALKLALAGASVAVAALAATLGSSASPSSFEWGAPAPHTAVQPPAGATRQVSPGHVVRL